MATHDYVIANQGFPSFRSDLNSVLQAVVSNNSGASEPSTKYAYQMWYETDTNIWKMRNADNDDWIPLATFNQTNNTVNFTDSSATVAGISTSASTTVMTLANGSVAINPAGFVSVGGAATQAGEIRFLEDTDNGSNYIALRAGAIGTNVTLTLPTAAGSNGQFLKTDGSGNLSFADAGAGGSDKQIQFNNSGAFGGITMGSNGQVLSTNGTTASFTDPAGGGTDWQAVKTSGFTAVGGEGYFCNTTSAAFTVTLPSSPSIGDEVAIVDYAGTFDSNNLTVGRNSKNIQGSASDLTVATERAGFTLVFTDNTQGWLIKNN
tara:strand:- start:209 stop:1168 length:960 start_codon:yes stop_codon:yes gene_type:complete